MNHEWVCIKINAGKTFTNNLFFIPDPMINMNMIWEWTVSSSESVYVQL